jgi:hypothetical protein
VVAGEHDVYVVFLAEFRLLPQEVDALDPEFVEELLDYLTARNGARREQSRRGGA